MGGENALEKCILFSLPPSGWYVLVQEAAITTFLFPSNIASEMPKLLISKFNLVRRILCHLLLMNKAGEEASRCERMPRMLALVWTFLADGDFNIGWVALTVSRVEAAISF